MITAITNFPKVNYNRPTYQQMSYTSKIQPKYDSVSFTSKNLLKLPPEEISKIVKDAIRKENFLGSGRFGEVYKIPKTDYCIKILKNNWIYTTFGKWTTEIDCADKANHILAKAENGSTIMKYIKGKSLFEYAEREFLTDLPDSTYIKLLKQISDAERLGLAFDYAPANVIYDAEKETLTAIDFYRPGFGFDLYPFTQVFLALESKNTGYQNLIINKKLAGRLMNIALDEYTKTGKSEFKFDDADVIRFVQRFGYNYSTSLPPQYKFLKQKFIDIIELKKAQRRGEDVEIELAGIIKHAKSLVRQVLTDVSVIAEALHKTPFPDFLRFSP